MAVAYPVSPVGQILSLLDCMSARLLDLPDDRKTELEGDICKIRSCMEDLAAAGRNEEQPARLTACAEAHTAAGTRYQDMVESIQDGLLNINRDWVITYINHRAARNGGYEPGELVGRNIWEVFPRLQGTPLEENYRRVMSERVPLRAELRGAYRDQLYSISVYPSADGITVYWLDITEHVLVERDLTDLKEEAERTAAQMQAIMDNMTDGLIIADGQGNVLYHNPVSLALHGYQSLEQVRHPMQETAGIWEATDLNGRRLPLAEWPLARALSGERFSEYEVWVKRTDTGQSFTGSFNGVPVYDPNGRMMLAVLTIRDITERKRAEEALRKSEEKFAKAFRSSPTALAITRLSDGVYLDVNDTLCQLIGYSRDEMLGQTTFDMGIYLSMEERDQLVSDLQSKGAIREYEKTIRNRFGEPVSAIVSIEPIEVGGEACLLVTLVDITERKRTEVALQKSEAMFAQAFRSSPIAMAVTRVVDGQYVDVNDSHYELLGYTREELIGHTTVEMGLFSRPDEREQLLRLLAQQGSVRNYLLKVRTKAGEMRSQLLSLEPFERYGEACLLGTVIDVTERMRAEEELRKNTEALRESEEKFRGAFIHAAIGFAMVTPQGHFVDANPAYCALTGYTLEELHTFAFEQLIHPDDRAYNLAMNERMSAGEIDDFVIENRYIRKDGQVVWVRKSVSQVRGIGNRPKWNIALVEDVTERRQAEMLLNERNTALAQAHDELVNERNRLLAVMEALPVGLAIYDLKGGVQQANQGFEAVWGSPRPPAHSVGDYDLYKAWWVESGQRVQPEEWAAARAVQKGETVTGQYIRIQKFDGTTGYILNSGAPFCNGQGQIIGGAVAIMEITAQKQLEIEQEESKMQMEVQRRLLEYREKERQEIARDLHDGPLQLLSSTIFNLQIAKETAQDPLLRLEVEQAMLNLKGSIRELREIMNALRPPAIIRFGFAKTARMHAEDFREKHPEIKLTLQVIEDSSLLSETARLALYRIFQESLNNIAKHANASQVWVRSSKKGNQFTLQIRDNGSGFIVPADLIGHTQKGHYGLAGMKERAEAIGGTLTVSAEPGKGAKIEVVVPIQDPKLDGMPERQE